MNSGLRVNIISEGSKHATVAISGYLTGDSAITVLTAKSLNPQPKSLQIEAITHAIQEKMGIFLEWGRKGEQEAEVILPMESKGKLDFSAFRGLPSPADWDGALILRSFNFQLEPKAERKYFLLLLQLEKK